MSRLILALLAASFLSACGTADRAEATFTLQNDTDEVRYVQDYEWFRLVADGEIVSTTDALCMQRCGDIFGGQVICAGARLATVIELQPGDSVERAWGGAYYEIDEERQCYREHSRGGDLEVEYCWGEDFNREGLTTDESPSDGVYEGGWIDDPICKRQPFERGDVVELSIE